MSLKTILTTINPQIRLAGILLSAIDANNTGLDDAASAQALALANAIDAYLNSFPASTIAKGYEATKAFCDNVLNSMDIVLASEATKSEKLTQCHALFNSLNDTTQIYQSKKGKDADYLNNAKVSGRAKLASLV